MIGFLFWLFGFVFKMAITLLVASILTVFIEAETGSSRAAGILGAVFWLFLLFH